ncbi:MAG: DUF423 domain-containing protein [Chromatiaceae bacterium]|nr:MAG: DUF423 domain-containing protein [Chromatiaceae bacterium]
MSRRILLIGALFGLVAVLLGAFGAHGLATRVSPERLAIWHTGAEYLGWHATALLALAALWGQHPHWRGLGLAAGCLIAGSLLFSGSLFLLVLTGMRALGAVTPIGGLLLAAGWALLALAVVRGDRGERVDSG